MHCWRLPNRFRSGRRGRGFWLNFSKLESCFLHITFHQPRFQCCAGQTKVRLHQCHRPDCASPPSRDSVDAPVEQALRLDATCVVVNLFRIPGQPEVTDQCIQNILRIKPECDRYAMPLMIEPLVFQPNAKAGGYMVDGDVQKILPLVRQAVELGADIIKADPTDDVSVYHRVVQIAGGIPVLVRGGGKASDSEILQRTEQLIAQGAAGIVYGRNIIQHANPAGMTRALMSLVHDGATAAQAARFLA